LVSLKAYGFLESFNKALMVKKRTRKEKKEAHYQFLWKLNQAEIVPQVSLVKSHFPTKEISAPKTKTEAKKATNSEKDLNITAIKKDMLKSIVLTTFILSLELVLYFAWK